MKKGITVVIYTYNEAKNIVDCIESARLLSANVIVIDSQSTDETVFLACQKGIKVFSFPNTHYVEPARKFGINKAKTEWVFILDADERITAVLAGEIKKRIEEEFFGAYRVLRKNIFGRTKWLKHGGWWPDYQIRLINKDKFIDWPARIHSIPKIRGKQSLLTNPLIHYFHGDFETMVEKTIIFENIEANLLFKAKRKVNQLTFFRKFFGELWRRLIKNKGFLDGEIGIMEAIYQAFSKTITYLFLYEKKIGRSL